MQEENKDLNNEIEDGESGLLVYELGYLILPTIDDAKISEVVYSLKAPIENAKGTIISEGYPALKPIAYEMTKKVEGKKQIYNQAYFGWFKFEIEKEKILEIDKQLDNNEFLLRFLLIKTVREDTLYSNKVLNKKEKYIKKTVVDAQPVEQASDEEIDKSIDKLVASQ